MVGGRVAWRLVRDYYEELWARLPDRLTPPDFQRRRAWLRAAVRPADRALDLGCGDGVFTGELTAAGAATVVGVDVAQAALTRARARHPDLAFHRVAFDGPLPFADASFDLVWASEVIEHTADTARFLSELRRVLTPGGRVALTTPDHGRLRLLIDGIEPHSPPLGDHLHLYTRRSLRTILSEFGFTDITVTAPGPPWRYRPLLAHATR